MISEEIKKEFKGAFQHIYLDEPLAEKTYIKIGGPAELYVEVHSEEELESALQKAIKHQIPFFILGRGCNIVFTDEGFHGLVIRPILTDITMTSETEILVGVGATLLDVVFFSHRNGLIGLEDLSGIPSSVGGAIYGNAGAGKKEIGDFVSSATVLEIDHENKKIEKRILSKEELGFAYRHSALKNMKDVVILSAKMQLEKGDTKHAKNEIEAHFDARAHAQPLSYPSAGCVFKNPPGESAGMLIQEAGLKGTRVGDMQISEKHGNFIINLGKGTFKEYQELVSLAQKTIHEKYNLNLEMEHIVVEPD
jgi:UDP-N-acetylmuramate dehydrogenase